MSIILQSDKNTYAVRYESVTEFEDLKHHEVNDGHYVIKANYEEGRNWLGPSISKLEELKGLLKYGWKDGEDRARRVQDQIKNEIDVAGQTVNRRRRVRGDHGDEIEMQRVYSGELDKAWSSCKRIQFVAKPVIRIMTNIGGDSGKSGQQLFYKGVCSAVLTDILESNGYRVEVVGYLNATGVYGTYTDGPYSFYNEIIFKKAESPLDFNRLLRCTALAGWFRYHSFKAMLSLPYRCSSGLGRPHESPPRKFVPDGTIVLNNVYSEWDAVYKIRHAIDSLKTMDKAV